MLEGESSSVNCGGSDASGGLELEGSETTELDDAGASSAAEFAELSISHATGDTSVEEM